MFAQCFKSVKVIIYLLRASRLGLMCLLFTKKQTLLYSVMY